MGEVACSPVCVFVGLPGSGKTTAAKRLSRALQLPFADTDQIIEERYGKSCGEVFTELGEKAFRDVEEDVVAEALASYGGILALGGGAILSTDPYFVDGRTGYFSRYFCRRGYPAHKWNGYASCACGG